MPIVSELVEIGQQQLSDAAQSQFGLTAAAIGDTLQVAASLAIILVFINALLQIRPQPVGDLLILVVKLLLIFQFATVWSQFNAIASAVINGMDSIAGAMLSGSSNPNMGLAASFDDMLDRLATSANTTMDNLSYMSRAVMSGIFFILHSLTAAVAGLILIFALVMITIHLGLAPIFIGLSVFKATSDFFFQWLRSTLSYVLYPIVIAAVLGSMIRLTQGVVDNLDPTNIESIAGLVPFLTILFMMIFTIVLIPMIVSGLSGMVAAVGPLAAAAVTAGVYRNLSGSMAGPAALSRSFRGAGSGGNAGSSPPAPGPGPGAGASPASPHQAQPSVQRQLNMPNRFRDRS
jgi:type IV secretion system protein VirB6|tara:strand:- start:14 stop:1054 length:1041 start_codon:yes stop_codon:yes gene_type:complete